MSEGRDARCTNDIDRSDVLETVEEIGPAEAFEIYDEMYKGQKDCPECGRETEEYKEYAAEVRAVLLELVYENRLVQNADRKYRIQSVDMDTDRDDADMDDTDRFHVCVTCGRIKHEDLFEDGDCTCDDCYRKGRSDVNWREGDDGDGFVPAESTGEDQ